MVFDLEFTAKADNDLSLILTYYASERPNLVERFIKSVDSKIELIRANPEIFALKKKQYRAVTLGDFPYTLYFEIRSHKIIVAALIHHSRGQEFIKGRLH